MDWRYTVKLGCYQANNLVGFFVMRLCSFADSFTIFSYDRIFGEHVVSSHACIFLYKEVQLLRCDGLRISDFYPVAPVRNKLANLPRISCHQL